MAPVSNLWQVVLLARSLKGNRFYFYNYRDARECLFPFSCGRAFLMAA